MAEVSKTIGEWERKKNWIIRGANPKDKLTEKEFDKIAQSGTQGIGVDHESRIKFLKDNDYEVTRENMVDGTLQSRGQ